MFDELFPGMGLAGMYGGNPGMMFGGMPQYKQPGSDIFADVGLMSPQQKMFQGIEMQNMMEQNQLAREQQMMALQSMSMNMGANAAKVGSGLAGPMLMAMGGLKPAWSAQLTQGLNGLIGKIAGGNNVSGVNATQMTNGMPDPAKILDQAIQASGGDPAKGYGRAADTLSHFADSMEGSDPTAAENLRQAVVRMRAQAYALSQREAASAASTQADKAKANEANTRADSIRLNMGMPKPLGTVRNAQGWQGLMYAQVGPDGKIHKYTTGWGPNLTYADPGTPGGWQKNGDSFMEFANSNAKALQRISTLEDQVRKGAPIGWAQKGVSFFNDLLGTVKQLSPGDNNIPKDMQDYVNKTFSDTFQSWANKGEIAESTAQDMVMTLASSFAAGRQVSRADISRAEAIVGIATSNPETLIPVLDAVKARTIQDVHRTGKFFLAGGEGNKAYATRINGILDTFDKLSNPSPVQTNPAGGLSQPVAPTGTIRVKAPDGRTGTIPAAQLQAAIAKGYVQVQ